MKKILAASTIIGVTLLSSCVQNSGNTDSKYQVLNRQRAIFMVDKNTGETYRMIMVKDQKPTWESLGSPEDAE